MRRVMTVISFAAIAILLLLAIIARHTWCANWSQAWNNVCDIASVVGCIASIGGLAFELYKWREGRRQSKLEKQLELFSRILFQYFEVRLFVGQVMRRSYEGDIDNENPYRRINHLLGNQLKIFLQGMTPRCFSRQEVVSLFSEEVFLLCKEFEKWCDALHDGSKDLPIEQFKINLNNVKNKAMHACDTWDRILDKCRALIGTKKEVFDAIVQDVYERIV